MVTILLIALSFIVLFYLFGYGLSQFIIPKTLRPYTPYLMPIIGYAVAMTVLQNLGGFLAMRYAIWVLIALCLVLNIYSLFWRRNRKPVPARDSSFKISNWKPQVLYVLSLAISLWPILYAGFPTSFALTNNDGYWYITLHKWLQFHTYSTVPAITSAHPWYISIRQPLLLFIRGVNLVPAGFDSLLGADPYMTMSILSGVLIAFVPIAIYLVCRACFSLSERTALLAAILAALNSSVLKAHFEANFHQVSGFIFLVLAIGFLYYALENKNWRTMIIGGLFISSLINSYYEFLPFFVLLVAGFVAYRVLWCKDRKQVITTLLMVTIVSVGLNVRATICAAQLLFSWTQFRNAGIIPFMGITQNLAALFGIANLYDLQSLYYRLPLFGIGLKFILVGAITVLIYGVWRMSTKLRALLGVGLILCALPFTYMFMQEYSYGVFKGLQAVTLIIDIVMAIGFVGYLESSKMNRFRNIGKLAALGVLILMIAISAISVSRILRSASPPTLIIGHEFPELADFAKTRPKNTVFMLEGNDSKYSLIHFEHYPVYFINGIAGRGVSFHSNPMGFFREGDLPADYFIRTDYDYIITATKPITRSWRSYDKKLNEILVYKRAKTVDLTTFGEDWRGGGEKNGQPVKWLNSGASISAQVDVTQTKRLSLKVFSVVPDRKISVEVSTNGKLIGKILVASNVGELKTDSFILMKGTNRIDLTVKTEGPVLPVTDIAVGIMDVRVLD
jgi:hypothetical protein